MAFDFKVNDLYFDIVSRENRTLSFSGLAADIEDLTIPFIIDINGEQWYVSSIKNQAVRSSSLLKLTLSNGIESVGDFGFSRCSNLKEVNLPTSLKTIGAYAFAHCNISDLYIEPSWGEAPHLEIGYHAFDDNKLSILNLRNVSIIGDNAFEGNRFLTTVYLHQCYYIGKEAFNYDYAIKTIVCNNRTPATLAASSFPANVEHYANVYVPVGSVNDFSTNSNWAGFGSNIKQTDVFTGFDSYCLFYEYSNDNVDLQPYLLINGELYNQWPFEYFYSPGPYVKPGESAIFTVNPVPGHKLVYASFSDANVYAKDILLDLTRDGFYKVDNVTSSIAINVSFDVDDAGIEDTKFSNDRLPLVYYNAFGVKSNEPFKGINIVKYSDGSIKKVIF